ncbi:glycerophosphodiester phosphodiesterase family protein [Hoeflea prorocentri]|uniref:Glycerophosphodiester phosphodiesterase family protein n=1 Tax=Hoeflea prorocentri TaxID=1922333 RepID=A0A9X3UHY8_9HYPH|nr:glycerophosphodiester phosphodiesterase family protein [Hoeflea prorocentri]MCY6380951.1 glycerophosphodiester phosphodiesterase family protein [Hoeflea prorocentri]MDA5398751.1 glycerophosphodiester phosphodiesterase family protein [Hoeflea prorocentri]
MSAGWIIDKPIAHRGYHDLNRMVWENTRTAFDRAMNMSIPIECDLQMTGDGSAIVFHDYETDRLCGVEGTVRTMDTEALVQLPIGTGADTIPTFRDLLNQVDGRVGLVVELKKPAPLDADAFASAVLSDLQDYDGKLALMSFDPVLLGCLLDKQATWPLGLVAAEFNEDDKRRNEDALSLPLDFVSFCVKHLPSSFVTRVRAAGLPVISWTIRDQETLETARAHTDQITFEGFDPLVLPD